MIPISFSNKEDETSSIDRDVESKEVDHSSSGHEGCDCIEINLETLRRQVVRKYVEAILYRNC